MQSTNNISVNYRIVSNKSQFSIDEKGVLKLSKQLDYEKNHIHKIGIIAETDSSPPLSSFIESIVYVRDVYEASTKFESDVYVIDVSEAVSTNTALLKGLLNMFIKIECICNFIQMQFSFYMDNIKYR